MVRVGDVDHAGLRKIDFPSSIACAVCWWTGKRSIGGSGEALSNQAPSAIARRKSDARRARTNGAASSVRDAEQVDAVRSDEDEDHRRQRSGTGQASSPTCVPGERPKASAVRPESATSHAQALPLAGARAGTRAIAAWSALPHHRRRPG